MFKLADWILQTALQSSTQEKKKTQSSLFQSSCHAPSFLLVYLVLNCTFIPRLWYNHCKNTPRLLGALRGGKSTLLMQASLVRGHQWITSVNTLLIPLPSLFLYNLSYSLTNFTILHTLEYCKSRNTFHTLFLKYMVDFKSTLRFSKSLKYSAVVCTDTIPNLSSAVPPCPGLSTQSGFPSRNPRKGQAGKLTTSKLTLSEKRLWKYIFTNWWKSNI